MHNMQGRKNSWRKAGRILPTDRIPCVTNICSQVRKGSNGAGYSVAMVQATGPVRHSLTGEGSRNPSVCLDHVCTRIPDSTIPVFDGLLDRIGLSSRADRLYLSLDLAHPTALAVRAVPGMPSLLIVELDRQPLWRIMHTRRILIDPGHGGDDPGGRGPIDLLEKRMTLAVAQHLGGELGAMGAEALLTRSEDANLTLTRTPGTGRTPSGRRHDLFAYGLVPRSGCRGDQGGLA